MFHWEPRIFFCGIEHAERNSRTIIILTLALALIAGCMMGKHKEFYFLIARSLCCVIRGVALDSERLCYVGCSPTNARDITAYSLPTTCEWCAFFFSDVIVLATNLCIELIIIFMLNASSNELQYQYRVTNITLREKKICRCVDWFNW